MHPTSQDRNKAGRSDAPPPTFVRPVMIELHLLHVRFRVHGSRPERALGSTELKTPLSNITIYLYCINFNNLSVALRCSVPDLFRTHRRASELDVRTRLRSNQLRHPCPDCVPDGLFLSFSNTIPSGAVPFPSLQPPRLGNSGTDPRFTKDSGMSAY